jgi:hypothetical protein
MWPRAIVIATIFAFSISAVAPAAPPPKEPEDVLRDFGASIIRGVDMDICFPATSGEYEALGKNAILMLSSWTAVPTELPLKSAYLEVGGIRVPLQRIARSRMREELKGGETYAEQTSFYLLPISLLKKTGEIAVDFKGPRTSFGVSSYSPKSSLLKGAPSFVRLDEYDAPSEADMAVVETVLRREYPNDYSGTRQ